MQPFLQKHARTDMEINIIQCMDNFNTAKQIAIRRIAVREISVSRHNRGPIEILLTALLNQIITLTY